jgi:hypothetical protein
LKQEQWKVEVTNFISEILKSESTRDALIYEVSKNILNFWNHRSEIANGFSLYLFKNSNAIFESEVLASSVCRADELVAYLEEDQEVYSYEYLSFVTEKFSIWLAESWEEIIKKRLQVENKFSHGEDFVRLRRFFVAAREAGLHFYTKDSDGVGTDLIKETITSDVIHSSYESVREIKDRFVFKELAAVMDACKEPLGFSNYNIELIAQTTEMKMEFFGPGYAHPLYKLSKKIKIEFAESLARSLRDIGVSANLDLKLKPRGDRIEFDARWERRLPECFYKISP